MDETGKDYGMILAAAAEQLEGGTEDGRFHAVRELARAVFPASIQFLLKAVGDESYRVREKALEGICCFPPEVIFPRLEAFLRDHENANFRTAAMEAYPRYGREAVGYLEKLLGDSDEEVRTFCAVMLGEIHDPLAVGPLIAALKDSDENVRHAAAESLGRVGDDRAVLPLIECLQEDFWVQYPAVVGLGNLGDPRAAGYLLRLLDDEMLRQAAIEALGKIGDGATIPVLGEMLAVADPSVRNEVIAALVRIQSRFHREKVEEGKGVDSRIRESLGGAELSEHLFESLRSPELEIRRNAVIALGWLSDKKAVRPLVELLGDYELEEYVAGSLASLGEAALPELLANLSHPNPRARVSVIRCLDWIGKAEGIRACLPLLDDENEEVRFQAVSTLAGALETAEVEEALLGKLADPDPEFRGAVIQVLGESRSPELGEKLIRAVTGGEPARKLAAIRLLGRRKDSRALPILTSSLESGSDEIRAEAYRAISAIAPAELANKLLLGGLRDESPAVKKAAAESLAAIADHSSAESLLPYLKDLDPEIRLTVIEALGRIGKVSCIRPLIEVFEEGNKRIRMAVIRALGNIRDRVSLQFLSDCLKEGDAELRHAAVESLGKVSDGRSVPDLIVALDDADWSTRSAAVQALSRIGDRRAAGRLLEKLKDPEDIIKRETIAALAELGAQEAVNDILPLIHNENLQLEVLNAVKKLGVSDLVFYFDFLKRSNTRLKGYLVEVLGRLRDPRAVDHLVNILEEEFFTVRARAARALGEIGEHRAIPFLLKAQKDDPSAEVQKEAAWALQRLDERE